MGYNSQIKYDSKKKCLLYFEEKTNQYLTVLFRKGFIYTVFANKSDKEAIETVA